MAFVARSRTASGSSARKPWEVVERYVDDDVRAVGRCPAYRPGAPA